MKAEKKSRRSVRHGAALVGSAAALTLACSPVAKAASTPITFANFAETGTPGSANTFAYNDNGPSGDAELVSSVSIPVSFNFVSITSGLPSDLQGVQNATLTLTSSTTTPVVTTPIFGETAAFQQIGTTVTNAVLTITRDTPAAEGNNLRQNLLTMDFTGVLGGLLGSNVPVLQGSTSNGNVVTYTSDFLNFTSVTGSDFNVAFSSWITNADGNGLELSANTNDVYFASATAAAAGTFDTTVPTVNIFVPEPSGWPLAALGGLILLTKRRRRAAC